jgi:hypothetical protein
MTDHLIDVGIATRGLQSRSADPALGCPADETFAGYGAALLPASERSAFEHHLLRCADCHELLRAVIDGLAVHRPVTVRAAALPTTRLTARLLARGLALVDHVQGALADLAAPAEPSATHPAVQPALRPALGALRRSPSGEPATATGADLLRIKGPGGGLDALELQLQADGTLRLVVSGHLPSDQRVGEILSVVLDHEGQSREQRPFEGRPVGFAPISAGHWRVRLVGRVPGESPRELAQAELELQK